MSSAAIKLKLFRKLDSLDKSKLEKAYRLLINFFNQDNDKTVWNKLSQTQQQGLIDAEIEMDNATGTDHQTIVEKHKQK